MKKLLYILLLLFTGKTMNAQMRYTLNGTVNGSTGETLIGATIAIKETGQSTTTDSQGKFKLLLTQQGQKDRQELHLQVSYMGYQTYEQPLDWGADRLLAIVLELATTSLQEVTVSTGYQQIAKERATGAFEQIGSELIGRGVSGNILNRLEGLSAVTLFDQRNANTFNGTGSTPNILVRGVNSINAGTAPLIVLDNFPYQGDINSINPNDILSISILKDAAAASIWGASAGNGVIVIISKSGQLNQAMKVNFSSNINWKAKPRLMEQQLLPSAEFIELQASLFDKGYYNSQENNNRKPALSPAVELLIAHRDGQLTEEMLEQELNRMKTKDVRDDYLQQVYRQALTQQYALNLRGGSQRHSYYASVGYDKNLYALKSNEGERLTFRLQNSLKPIDRLELKGSLQYSQNQQLTLSPSAALGYGQLQIGAKQLYPYASLSNADGSPAVIDKDYRGSYTRTLGNGQLLDWDYRPLAELALAGDRSKRYTLVGDIAASYRFFKGISAELKYQYQQNINEENDLLHQESYYTRNLINRFTQVNGTNLLRPIPLGDILDYSTFSSLSNALRGQINVQQYWGNGHELDAIIGTEIRQQNSKSKGFRTYGFSDELLTYGNVNFTTVYPAYGNLAASAVIPNTVSFGEQLNRYVALFANAAYTYQKRYTISGSVRKDASNLFGVNTNQKGVPLWSVGGLWNIANEDFYHFDHLPYLKLRASLGVAGNVDNGRSAYTTMNYYPAPNTINNLVYANVVNPPNANLRWEKVQTFNLGLDFEGKGRRISGSFDWYKKNTTDLLGAEPADPTIGFTSRTLNGAATMGNGFELQLNTVNLNKALRWESNLLLAHSLTKVSRYLNTASTTRLVSNGSSINPIQDELVYPLFSYQWAGLNAATGAPMGFVAGEKSEDYSTIVNRSPINELVYHGSAIPLYYGAFRQTFSYRHFSLSANLTFKMDYFFRRASIHYTNLFANNVGHPDYTKRWQQAGDEAITQVPAMVYPAISNRDVFYNNSEVTVERGDHIRLQDLRLAYSLSKPNSNRLSFQNLQIFAYASDLGILWRANQLGLDPDNGFNGVPVSRQLAIGLKIDL
ncbi:SusC/RagA family TonB-linked outer membrane protein [Pedobacter alpinus]|uniref:SusC/RagA family TonB-linked outer membrane protein n=1 Tax=Pedobacter alpinus TaxID=1590643 RepID=A0ABW5TPB3_9SPHI